MKMKGTFGVTGLGLSLGLGLALTSSLVGGTAQAAAPAAAPAPNAVLAPAPRRGARNEDARYREAVAARDARMAKLSPVTDAVLANPPESDWLVWRRTYEGLGYSPLAQITKRNVANLSVAWSWPLPVSPNEITPLIHEGVMFIASANRIFALDAATGDQLWQHTRQLPEGNTGAGLRAKNLAIHEDRLFVTTADRHLMALDMRTGKMLWDQALVPADAAGVNVTGGPIVARGKVIIGVTSCNTFKGGCYIVALDSKTGAEAWRFYTIARPGEPGGDTWNGAPLDERFGGAIWTSGSYDPELNLVYIGLGQTYNAATLLTPRPGQTAVSNNDALYTSATVALNPDTGKLVWHYQHFNRDIWDMDWVFERSLMTLPVNGINRKVVVTGGKLAIFDALDRTNGQYLFSKDVGIQNLVSSIDPVTGKKNVDPRFTPEANVPHTICPHAGGARSWPSTAYNPRSGILFVPLVESCMDFTWRQRTASETAAGGSDIGWVLKPRADTDGNFGRVDAIDLKTGKTVWSQRRRAPEISALLATGGGLVFAGSRDRVFRAMDEATGKILWQTKLSTVPSSFPITYSVAGKQYVAVVSGGGGAHEATWPTLTPEIENPAGSTSVWVFALPDR